MVQQRCLELLVWYQVNRILFTFTRMCLCSLIFWPGAPQGSTTCPHGFFSIFFVFIPVLFPLSTPSCPSGYLCNPVSCLLGLSSASALAHPSATSKAPLAASKALSADSEALSADSKALSAASESFHGARVLPNINFSILQYS